MTEEYTEDGEVLELNEDGEVFETDEDEIDWDGYLTEGLLPVSRIHINILKADVKTKTNQSTGESYRSIGVQYEIDSHEELGDAYPGEGKKTKKAWMNFYFSGKTASRFRALYKGCTGGAMKSTGFNEKTKKPTVNMASCVKDIRGLGCYTTLTWFKRDGNDDDIEESLGWDFSQQIDAIRKPVNKFLKTEEG